MHSLVPMRFMHVIDSVVVTCIMECYSIICLYFNLSFFFLMGICVVSSLKL